MHACIYTHVCVWGGILVGVYLCEYVCMCVCTSVRARMCMCLCSCLEKKDKDKLYISAY